MGSVDNQQQNGNMGDMSIIYSGFKQDDTQNARVIDPRESMQDRGKLMIDR